MAPKNDDSMMSAINAICHASARVYVQREEVIDVLRRRGIANPEAAFTALERISQGKKRALRAKALDILDSLYQEALRAQP